MDILALDLSGNTGWARGPAGKIPNSGSVRLGKDGYGPGQLGLWLRDHVRLYGKPDLIGIEKWMAVNAQRSDKNIETALRLDGAVHAMAGVYRVKTVELDVNTVRATVCGQKSGGMIMTPGMSKNARRDAQRQATKQMVVRTMRMLTLMPADAVYDDDRADALCLWRYCEAVYGRTAPADFVLLP